MKKKQSHVYLTAPTPHFTKQSNYAQKSDPKEDHFPPPPSEETLFRLNQIVKQSPFCFYYREKENDSL